MRISSRNAAFTGIALASLSWLVLLFAGFGGEKAACPGDAALQKTISISVREPSEAMHVGPEVGLRGPLCLLRVGSRKDHGRDLLLRRVFL